MPETLLRPGRRPRQFAAARVMRVCLATATLALTACGGGDTGNNVNPRPGTVSTVRIAPSSATVDTEIGRAHV